MHKYKASFKDASHIKRPEPSVILSRIINNFSIICDLSLLLELSTFERRI